MQKFEPKKWRTDLVLLIRNDPVFFKDGSSFLNQLNCSFLNKRTSKHDRPMCTLVNYTALKNRVTTLVPQNTDYKDIIARTDIFSDKPDNLLMFYAALKKNLRTYAPVDSILVGFDGYEYLKTAGFDFVMRTDMDVFLTPMFAKWLPQNCNDFYAGKGGYTTDFNTRRLGRIAEDLGFGNAGLTNLGSTWYSTPEQIRLISFYTLLSMVGCTCLSATDYINLFTMSQKKANLKKLPR